MDAHRARACTRCTRFLHEADYAPRFPRNRKILGFGAQWPSLISGKRARVFPRHARRRRDSSDDWRRPHSVPSSAWRRRVWNRERVCGRSDARGDRCSQSAETSLKENERESGKNRRAVYYHRECATLCAARVDKRRVHEEEKTRLPFLFLFSFLLFRPGVSSDFFSLFLSLSFALPFFISLSLSLSLFISFSLSLSLSVSLARQNEASGGDWRKRCASE